MPLNVLIVGAGVCGPAFATLLQRSNTPYNITVVEKAPSLRLSGQQLDLKAHGYPIVKKMGLLDAVKARGVGETGAEMVNSKGDVIARFGVNDAEKDESSFLTNEYEIMRGDLVKVFYEASLDQRARLDAAGRPGALTYEFGKTITELAQQDQEGGGDENKKQNDGVDVSFSDGQKKRFDLVVGADGQGSRTRRLLFGQQVSDAAYRSLGIHAAFYTIPRAEGEGSAAQIYIGPGSRGVVTRTGDQPRKQVYLFAMGGKSVEQLSQADTRGDPLEKRKQLWAELFRDAGWQSEKLTQTTGDDFHAWELAQVRLDRLHRGRVALLGDAGYCPTVFTGMGTTASLVGSWVLAGELARHSSGGGGVDVGAALRAYDETMRQPIEEWRQMLAGVSTIRLPSSRLGVWLLHNAVWVLSSLGSRLGFGQLSSGRPTEKEGAWRLPEYPELNPEA